MPEAIKTYRYLWAYTRSGAISGIISTFIFTIIHDIFISDIWYSFFIMAIAGIICGVCISISYGLLFKKPSIGSWLRYNLIFIAMFLLLGVVSVLIFEFIIIVAALMQANDRPDELINQAMPMTIIFTLSFTIFISILYVRRLLQYAAILVTSSVLMIFLGLNVSILGLVYIPTNAVYLIIELFGLIVALGLIYIITFMVLENKRLFLRQSLYLKGEND